jgi:hypothetical protein
LPGVVKRTIYGRTDLSENVRANKKYANLPFIMMTADPSIENIVQAKKAGVTCFIK